MKNIIYSIATLATFVLLNSFSLIDHSPFESVKVKTSKIVWKGYKVTGSHEGTLDLKSGSLSFEGEELNGGEFTIDMSSLACTDLSGEYKGKLEGHLKSDDFFSTQQHPTANLQITNVEDTGKNSYNVTADLTIKGITHSIDFDASIYGNKATANLKIDRTAFNVKYGSGSFFEGLKDNMIYDEFDLVIDIEF